MAKLPPGFSLQALPIERALSEGRTEDAKTLVCRILLAGEADAVVQGLAAQLIKPPKRGRGQPKSSSKKFWFEIGSDFHELRSSGTKYENCLLQLAEKYGYSETYVRGAIAEYDEAKAVSDEASAKYYE